MKIVIICKVLDLCLLTKKTPILFFGSSNSNCFGSRKRYFFAKILRHPRNRYWDFFVKFGMKFYVKSIKNRISDFEF